MPVDTENESDLWFFRRTINEAIGYCTLDIPGPVHVNIPLKEPLYNPLPKVIQTPRSINIISGNKDLSSESWQQITKNWKTYGKKLVVCGFSSKRNYELQVILNQMASNHEVIVMAENISNLFGDNFIDSPEQFMASLANNQLKYFKPDLLITIGGAVVSKRLKKYLRQYQPSEHWHVDENELFIDTYQSLNLNIRSRPEKFLKKVSGIGSKNPSYSDFAINLLKDIHAKQIAFVQDAEFSDLTAWFNVISCLPSDINLHLANSTPVRYAQLFASREDINYFSNRGTSGIDGCVSTAAGAATVSSKLNVLLLGDMAFVYDSNGLWNNNLPANLRIIVMDNGGGNIFRLIESGPEFDKIIPYMEMPHKIEIKELCAAYGINYVSANNMEDLKAILPTFYGDSNQPKVLHIKTSGNTSTQIFKQYFQYINNN
jgi:2-succinyl-5-enolpyruvyl-6-hydroxy-3-cyclohexene-1-carboxylate synthase